MLPLMLMSPCILLFVCFSSNGLQPEIATHFYGDSILLPTSNSGTSILIPGLNLGPMGTALWLLTILTATIFHELGHYIAAKWFKILIQL